MQELVMAGKDGFPDEPAPARGDLRTDARWALRMGTRGLHDRAERALGEGPMRDLGCYVGMLRANLRMTEATVHAVGKHLPRAMTEGLALDCARLDRDLACLGAERAPRAPVFHVRDRAGAMGAAYVCEGARLGGLVLARRAADAFGMTADNGAAYLHGDGAHSGARWRTFIAALNRELDTQEGIDRALAAACGVFTLIIADYEDI